MKPSAIIHFGLAKTGTTILQEYFACNREFLLREYGILYPSGPSNHYHFQTLISSTPENLIQIRREGISTRKDALNFARRFRESFEEELHDKRPERILFSSEYFAGSTAEEFLQIRPLFSQYSERQTAVAYMRDPWSHTTSALQQNVRDGQLAAPLRMGYRKGQAAIIRRIEHSYPGDTVVRPYFGGQGPRTDIVGDFCEFLGISQLPNHPGVSAENRSIGRVLTTVIAEFNRIWPQFDKDGLYIHSTDRDVALYNLSKLDIEDRPLVLSKRRANVIMESARNDLLEISQKYFSGNNYFEEYYMRQTFSDTDCEVSLEKLNVDDLAICFRALLREFYINSAGS